MADIDFDAASIAWRKDTLADDPVALRKKQINYWAKVDGTLKRVRVPPKRYGFTAECCATSSQGLAARPALS